MKNIQEEMTDNANTVKTHHEEAAEQMEAQDEQMNSLLCQQQDQAGAQATQLQP